MASNADFVEYIVDQCSGAGEIVAKKMFGDYGIYCDGKIFGLICDDCFYLKPTEAGRKLLRMVDMRPPYEGANPEPDCQCRQLGSDGKRIALRCILLGGLFSDRRPVIDALHRHTTTHNTVIRQHSVGRHRH